MKNKLKLLGIIALAAVIGFSVISCAESEGGGSSGIVGTWVLEMTRSESVAYAADFLGITVDVLEIQMEQAGVVIPAKVTSDKLVFTENEFTYYTLDMEGIMTAIATGGEINWEGMEEVATSDYSMDGNNLVVDSEVIGAISGSNFIAYDFYEDGEDAVFTKR